MPVSIGQHVGQYKLVREIGRGGMGVVYEAQEDTTGRHVALKLLPVGFCASPSHLRRFEREIRTTATLEHPNIVRVLNAGAHEGQPYYVMEFIDGISLSELIRSTATGAPLRVHLPVEGMSDDRSGEKTVIVHECGAGSDVAADEEPALGPARDTSSVTETLDARYYRTVARIIRDAASALGHAHRHGIIHRDVKPGNLLLTRSGEVRVTDFGLAVEEQGPALTKTGDTVGTPRYMSPEQLLKRRIKVDARTDVYSLGITLYELLTLTPAFAAGTRDQLILKVAVEEPKRPRQLAPNLPRDLETIALKAIEKDPAHRYQSAQLVADDLDRYLEGEPIIAFPPPPWVRAAKFVKRHKVLSAVVAAAVIFACAGMVGTRVAQRRRRDRTVHAKLVEAKVRGETWRSASSQVESLLPQIEQGKRDLHGVLPAGENAGDVAKVEVVLFENETKLAKALSQADTSFARAAAALHEALSLDPHNAAVRAMLAKLYYDALVEAERSGKARYVDLFHRLAGLYDDGRLAKALKGDGRLSLVTAPRGANVTIFRYIPSGDRLVLRAEGSMGPTPVADHPMPMGSYLLKIELAGHGTTNFPVLITRSENAEFTVPLFANDQIPEGMVYVPTGLCLLGGDDEAQWPLPRERRLVNGFFIGQKEVTGGEYLEFLRATDTDKSKPHPHVPVYDQLGNKNPWPRGADGIYVCPYPSPEMSVHGVSINDAKAYCQWLADKTGLPYRLPTSVEWEMAARGADGRFFPWGNRPSLVYANMRSVAKQTLQQGLGTAIGGRYPFDRSPYGAFDMAGNVGEACADLLHSTGEHVVKGGFWYMRYETAHLANRWPKLASTAQRALGFRVVCDLPEP